VDVIVSSAGRFWAFDLAEQLRQYGYLKVLYNAYPRWKIDRNLRPYSRNFPWVFSAHVLASRLGWARLADAMDWWAIDSFDRWVAQRLEPADVVVTLSGYGLYTRRAAKQMGALTVCDRGSTHILATDEILAEEYARHGIPYRGISSRLVEKELQEYAEADLITIPSTFVYETFLSKGVSPAKLRRIPYGVDLSLFKPVPKKDDVFRVIYVGQMSLRKGLPYLLEALCPLKIPRFELVLIGPLSREIRPFFARYEGQFQYLGVLPRSQLAYHYSQSSVFVIASVEEGLALVQAQAMSCGLPVIATTNTGAEDLFSDGVEGFIVPIRDAASIRERALRLYDHPDLRTEMGQAALERVKAMGGWTDYGRRTVEVYSEALKCRSSNAAVAAEQRAE
jgi:glycosyltransferase involved in cell wall biosynthesis